MRNSLFYILVVFVLNVQGQSVSGNMQNFGKVKLWNNPIVEIQYTNTSGEIQQFLPIWYQQDIKVNFEKSILQPGETTVIKIQYYTEDFGRFSKTVNVFISTQNTPLTFTLKGNIQSFHPDAFTICPRIDNSDLQRSRGFLHNIRVIDEVTKESLTDYEITLITRSSNETLINTKYLLTLKREKPDFYQLVVDKEGYEIERLDKYIQRNSSETVIVLKREESELQDDDYFDFSEITNDEEDVIENAENDLLVNDNDELGDETLEDKDESEEEEYFDFSKVDEEDEDENIISEGIQKDTIDGNQSVVVVPTLKDTLDFKEDGTLNSSKYTFNHLVFLIDVSTSMRNPENLPLLKKSMLEMIEVLRPEDQVSIITYSSKVIVLLSNVSGAEKDVLNLTIEKLVARGQSYGKEGIDLAYDLAKDHFIADGNNEIILASDGIFNSKNFSEKKLFRQARIQRNLYNVRISTIGFGKASKALIFLETLASKGDGSFIKISTEKEAETILIENIMQHSIK
ncbi:MAG: hypothetical protein COA58_07000 [Bacteroidetes bacterium]|nr:MAG: hypothetical protein COA58_07000 [Bacteroidota bacterium]